MVFDFPFLPFPNRMNRSCSGFACRSEYPHIAWKPLMYSASLSKIRSRWAFHCGHSAEGS